MTRIPKWTWLVTAALLVAFAGCADNDDGDDEGGGGVGGGYDGGDNNNDEGGGGVEARGSPGWGLIGSLGAILAVGYVVRKRLQ